MRAYGSGSNPDGATILANTLKNYMPYVNLAHILVGHHGSGAVRKTEERVPRCWSRRGLVQDRFVLLDATEQKAASGEVRFVAQASGLRVSPNAL